MPSHSKLIIFCSLLVGVALAFLFTHLRSEDPEGDLPVESLQQVEDEHPIQQWPEKVGPPPGNQPRESKRDSQPTRNTVQQELPLPAKAKRDIERVKEARHVLESSLEVPETIAMTDAEWQAFRRIHDKALAEVQRCDLAIHETGTEILERRLKQGRFEEDLVTGKRLPAEKPTKPGQVVLSRWMQNEKGQPVRRIVRIDPGESRTLDVLVASRDSARAFQKGSLHAFFRKILLRRRGH